MRTTRPPFIRNEKISTRKQLAERRSRGTRSRLIAATAIAAAGVLLGTGFLVQNAVSGSDSVQAAAEITSPSDYQHSRVTMEQAIADGLAKSKVDAQAKASIDQANQVIASAQGKVDATPLTASVASLSQYPMLDVQTVTALTSQTDAQAQSVQAAATAADQAAAAAAAEAAQQAEVAAEAQAQANTPDGARATARSMASSQYGWGDDQFQCLNSLWNKESGWSYTAYNAGGGATGIPQALPGSKMASFGDDWQTNATTQIAWGLDYIARGYGTPCSAWAHSQSVNWY